MLKRREIAALAELKLLLKVAGEVGLPCELDRRTERCVSLHEHFARRIAPAGATGHLGEKLERPFPGAEIWKVQREIGIDDSNQCHVGEMQPLGDHLCANKDVDLAR